MLSGMRNVKVAINQEPQNFASRWHQPWQNCGMRRISSALNLRTVIWTVGLAFVGFILASKETYSNFDSTIALGTVAGGAIGFAVGTLFSWIIKRQRS